MKPSELSRLQRSALVLCAAAALAGSAVAGSDGAVSAEAERLGLTGFFDEYGTQSGTVGVLRGDTREVVQVIRGATDPARYVTALEQARSSS